MNTRRNQGTPNRGGVQQVQQPTQRFGAIGQSTQPLQQVQQQKPVQQQQQQQEQKTILDGSQPLSGDTNGIKREKPAWQTRKVDPELRRLRQNARVKKVVKPKPAQVVLNEMHPDIVYKVDEVASNKTSIYRVHFELNGKKYSGEGFSKSQAKQQSCENALRDILLEKLSQEQETEKNQKEESVEDDGMEVDSEGKRKIPVDDFPWGKLAGFALQKLVENWTNKGAEVPPAYPPPLMGSNFGGSQSQSFHAYQQQQHPNHVSFSNYFANGPREPVFPKKPSSVTSNTPKRISLPRKTFPNNPLEYNPVALFNQTWPNVEPAFDSRTNAEGKPEHSGALVLEGFRFSHIGKSKKEVKTELSKAVISTLKGVKYADGFQAQVMQA